MKKILKILTVFALASALLAPLAACMKGGDPKIEPGENEYGRGQFYGLAEPAMSSIDSGQTLDMTLDLAGAFGFKSYRLFMHHSESFVARAKNENEVTLVPEAVERYKGYIKGLMDRGITDITAMSHYYPFPVGFKVTGDRPYGAFPKPGSPYYSDFMNLVEKTYYLVAKTFPEIKYFECGNENNADVNCRPPQAGTTYKVGEKAQIITDLCFFARRGIKRAGRETGAEASLVFPALIFDTKFNFVGSASGVQGAIPFLQAVYANINSGDFPYAEVDDDPLLKSSDNGDYFDVMSWHPYVMDGKSEYDGSYIQDNLAIYDVMKENGDEGKQVFFTELGYSTGRGSIGQVAMFEDEQGNFIQNDLKHIYEYLPFVTQIHMFRLFDWDDHWKNTAVNDHYDAGYGLFTSPGTGLPGDLGPRPKKIAVKLLQLIKGEDASLEPLYQYYKGQR
ncbi:MAG: hypothetical protein LBL66_00930 [Clostridiales bacterium]|jgi:hypothetical protein|nr:hypothetical protein [Clostridiales bacterium]